MGKVSSVQAARLLLGIISSVEAGVTTPEEAVEELAELTASAPKGFNPGTYTVADFERIRSNYVAQYDSSSEFEDSYVESTDSY